MTDPIPSNVIPFDTECITARILAEWLADAMAKQNISAAEMGKRIGVTDAAVLAWLHGDNLKQPVRFMAAVDALGYDVVFRKRKT